MVDTNILILVGRLTRDSELTYSNSGTAICKFSLAVHGYKKDDVSFFDVTIFGKTAENLNEYLVRGTQILLNGYIKQDRWEKQGQKQSKVSIIGNSVQLLGSKLTGETSRNAYNQSYDKRDIGGPEDFIDDSEAFFDDIPFN